MFDVLNMFSYKLISQHSEGTILGPTIFSLVAGFRTNSARGSANKDPFVYKQAITEHPRQDSVT
jgi:hypothetical protein